MAPKQIYVKFCPNVHVQKTVYSDHFRTCPVDSLEALSLYAASLTDESTHCQQLQPIEPTSSLLHHNERWDLHKSLLSTSLLIAIWMLRVNASSQPPRQTQTANDYWGAPLSARYLHHLWGTAVMINHIVYHQYGGREGLDYVVICFYQRGVDIATKSALDLRAYKSDKGCSIQFRSTIEDLSNLQ